MVAHRVMQSRSSGTVLARLCRVGIVILLFVAVITGAAGADEEGKILEELDNYIKEAQFTEAIALIEDALAKSPDDLFLQLRLADVASYSGDFERAKQEYARALEIDSSNLLAAVGHARMIALTGNHELAGRMLDGLAKEHPDHPVILRAQGELALWRSDATAAKRLFETYLDKVKDDYDIIEKLGDLYFAERKYLKARGLYQRARALRDTPRLATALEAVRDALVRSAAAEAISLSDAGKQAEALAALEKGGKESPDAKVLLEAKALIQLRAKDVEGAMETYTRARKLYGDDVAIAIAHARTLSLAKQHEEAITALSAIVQEHPDNIAARRALAEVAYKGRKQDLALEHLPVYLAAARDDTEALTWLGNLQFAKGHLDAAEATYRKVLAVSGPNEQIKGLLDSVISAKRAKIFQETLAADDPEEIAQAVKTLEELVAAEPRNLTFRLALAQAYAVLSKFEKAVKHYEAALAMDKGNADVMVALARNLRDAGKKEQAGARAAEALAIKPDAVTARAILADLALSKKDYAAAKEQLDKYLEKVPDDVYRLLLSGNVEIALDHLDAAQARFKHVIELQEDNDEAKRQLAEVERRRKEKADKAARLEREKVFKQAQELADAGKLKDAAKLLEDVSASEPRNVHYAMTLGGVLLKLKRHEQALDAFERARSSDPTSFDARIARANALRLLGRTKDAERELLQLKDERGDDSSVTLALGSLYFEDNQTGRALLVYTDYLELVPADHGIRMRAADILVSQGNYEAARDEYMVVFAAQPTDDLRKRLAYVDVLRGQEHARKGLAALKDEDLATAARQFELAVALDPGNNEYKLALARIRRRADDPDGAIALYEQVLESRPDSIPAELGIVNVMIDGGDVEGAMERLKELAEKHPDNLTVRRRIGRLYQRMGHPEKALAYFDDYLQRAPEDHEILESTANIRNRPGSYSKAARLYRRVLELDPGRQSAQERLDEIEQRERNLFETGYVFSVVDTPGDNVWQTYTARFTHLSLDGDAWWIRGQFLERYSLVDARIGFGGTHWIAEKAYLTANVDFGLDNTFTSDFETDWEISVETPLENLWMHAQYQLLLFDTSTVNLFSPALTYYWDRNSFHIRYFVSKDNRRPGHGQSLMIQLSTQWTDRFDTSVGYVIGSRIHDIVGIQEAGGADGQSVFGHVRFRFTDEIALRLEYSHSVEEPGFRADSYGVYGEVSF